MAASELVVFFGSMIVTGVCWGIRYVGLVRISRWHSSHLQRSPLYLIPVLCLGILYFFLTRLAASGVRSDTKYLVFYLLLGAAILGVANVVLPILGLDGRLDVAERGNRAATLVLCGALLGLTLCFGGANVGEGPGFHVVLLCALFSVGSWFLLWILHELLTGTTDVITIDRDQATGLRFACLLISAGLILGSAVTGRWSSFLGLCYHFSRLGWPVGPLLILAALLHWLGAPRPTRPRPGLVLWGVVPGGCYLLLTALYLWSLGWWQP